MRCTEDEAGKEVPIGEIFCFPIERVDAEGCNTDCGCDQGYCAYYWINTEPIPIPPPVSCDDIDGAWQLSSLASTCPDADPEVGEPGECACPDALPDILPEPDDFHGWDNKYFPVGCPGGEQAAFIYYNCERIVD